MEEVIKFDKSLQERLQEYTHVFSANETLSVSKIKEKWSYFVELSMDTCGWQAIWKIPRLLCETFNVPFPTITLVYVDNLNQDLLSASIKILAVQDENISLPEYHEVPLIQLWPTKVQDASVVLNIRSTANTLDMLRFFYTNLLMPWDYEEDDDVDWFKKHLESRLRLFYDSINGVIPTTFAKNIKLMFAESRLSFC